MCSTLSDPTRCMGCTVGSVSVEAAINPRCVNEQVWASVMQPCSRTVAEDANMSSQKLQHKFLHTGCGLLIFILIFFLACSIWALLFILLPFFSLILLMHLYMDWKFDYLQCSTQIPVAIWGKESQVFSKNVNPICFTGQRHKKLMRTRWSLTI